MNTYELKGLFAEIWATPGVSTITYSVLLNLVLAWAVAIKNKTFTLDRVADFMTQQLIPYVSVYAGAQFLGEGAGYGWLGNVAYVLVLAKMGASILSKLKELGVPVPDGLMQYIDDEKSISPRKIEAAIARDVKMDVLAQLKPSVDMIKDYQITAVPLPPLQAKVDIFAPSEGPSEIRSTGGDDGAKG